MGQHWVAAVFGNLLYLLELSETEAPKKTFLSYHEQA
jgi:hypothetical protein